MEEHSDIRSFRGSFKKGNIIIKPTVISYIADEIIKNGKIEYGMSGSKGFALSEVAKRGILGKDYNKEGIIITKVVKNSPADKAGLKIGDYLIERNGKKALYNKIKNFGDLELVPFLSFFGKDTAIKKPGDKEEWVILRNGKRVAISFNLASIKEINDLTIEEKKAKTKDPKRACYEWYNKS